MEAPPFTAGEDVTLGHPEHLASLSELGYAQKSESAVIDQLQVLEEHNLVTTHVLEESRNSRNLPRKFYGLTERGLQVLDEFKYLRGVPIPRAIHDNTVKPKRIQRHEEASRPDLPETVATALNFDEDVEDADVSGETETTSTAFAGKVTEDEAGTFADLFA